MVAAAAGLLGIGAYCWFNYQMSGNPFAWYNSITRWGYYPGGNPFSGHRGDRPRDCHSANGVTSTHERMAPYDTLNAMTAGRVGRGAVDLAAIWHRLRGDRRAGAILPLSSGQ